MNPDPNQPSEQPPVDAPVVETPVVEVPTPTTETPSMDAPAQPAPNPFGAAPSAPVAPNPFGAAPVSSDPVVPAQPVALGSAPGGSPVSAPAPSKKKLIILLSAIIGGLLVLGGAALAVYLTLFTVTKADYQKAFDQISIVRDAASKSSSTSLSSSEDAITTTKESYATFKTENAKLGSLKAYRGDKDLKAKYDAYNAKANAFIKFTDDFLPSIEAYVAVSKEVLGVDGSTSFSSANFEKALAIYKKADIKDPSLKAYIDATIAAYEEMLPQVKIYESSSSTTAQKSAAIKAFSTISLKLSTSSKELSKDLKERTDAVKFTDELNDLGKATTAKLNDAK